MTKRRSFIFFKWVGPAHMLFSRVRQYCPCYYRIFCYNLVSASFGYLSLKQNYKYSGDLHLQKQVGLIPSPVGQNLDICLSRFQLGTDP